MVDVKVAEQNHVQLRHLRPALSKPQSTSSAGINQYPRLPVLPYQIAGRSALVLQLRASGAEDLDGNTLRTAILRGPRWQQWATKETANQGKEARKHVLLSETSNGC